MLYDSTAVATLETKSGNGWVDTLTLGVPQLNALGLISNVKLLLNWEMDGANAPSTAYGVTAFGGAVPWTWNDTNAYVVTELDFTSSVSADEKESWDLESQVVITLDDRASTNGQVLRIREVGLEIEYKLEKGFGKMMHTVEYLTRTWEVEKSRTDDFDKRVDVWTETQSETTRLVTHQDKTAPKEVDIVYISAKGRKYGSWVDANSRNNGYNQNDLIQNPVYIIEDILRTELGLATASIDYTTFDTIGNTSNGTLGTAFGDAVFDVKFAFSQYKFIDGIGLINKICKQTGLYFFFNGEGKATLRQRLRAASYSSSNKTIDFNDCQFGGFNKTSINTVKNKININYQYDYGTEQTLSSDTSSDSTSRDKYATDSKYLTLELDADCIQDKTTAENLGNSYLDWLKDRKLVVSLSTVSPKYLDLEIGDIAIISNIPSDLKAYGTAIASSDYFIVTSISKLPNMTKLTLTEVS
tara:strand:+ start:2084 stop:3493 length:1410 start_codon:yes stop_codon:yes gene_type:complete